MRIISFNANGIRSAKTKGFFDWFLAQKADVLCVQELKAQEEDIYRAIGELAGFKSYFHCAKKKGYSGCGLWCRQVPKEVRYGFGSEEFDQEGRYVEADFGTVKIISSYFPSGSSSEIRQQAKFRFLNEMKTHMDYLHKCDADVIMCGDMNIAHKEIDLKNWRSNQEKLWFSP
ncbi:exodeoxyribonuclease III Xth [gut metagenome]|uniref:Exodeoxyribonuclease III Xth n=1 Tax=gut metagenome TaxID=749906 RepID=J9G6B4_9ZZZZ